MQSLWKAFWQFLKILNLELSYDPTVPLLVIYPRQMKPYGSTKICTHTFIATLLMIAEHRNYTNVYQMRHR